MGVALFWMIVVIALFWSSLETLKALERRLRNNRSKDDDTKTPAPK